MVKNSQRCLVFQNCQKVRENENSKIEGSGLRAGNMVLIEVARCLKITEKVSFNIASEANYVYILSGQKLIKNAKNGPFWRVFENLKLAVKQCYQTGQF